jgi:hypothetical protein
MDIPRYPFTGTFTTLEQVDAYFAQDPLPCLICGKAYKALHKHVQAGHHLHPDEYRAMFAIPWRRTLICNSMREHQAAIMNEQRERGILPSRPSDAHLQRLATTKFHRRPLVPSVRKAMSDHALSSHGREEKLNLADYSEYLRRIETGRTITEVGEDGLMCRETFETYCRRNPDFNAKVQEVLENLPAVVQVRGGRVGKKLRRELICLREEFEMEWPEIGEWLGLSDSKVRNLYHTMKNNGTLAEYRKVPLTEA